MREPPKAWPTEHIDFVFACDEAGGTAFYKAPVDVHVQGLLQGMLDQTLKAFEGDEDLEEYEFAQRYESTTSLRKDLSHAELDSVRGLADPAMAMVQIDASVVDKAEALSYYLVRFVTADNECLIGVRKASYFKSTVRQRQRFVRLVNDTLKSVDDRMFKLDWDFDFIISPPSDVFILRPANFETIAALETAIAEHLPARIKMMTEKLPFLDLSGLELETQQFKRVARLVSSVASRDDLDKIDMQFLVAHGMNTDVAFDMKGSQYVPRPGCIKGLLEILDRRRYHMSLNKDQVEKFVAGQRTKVGSSG